MALYRLSDAFLLPSLLSATRLALAAAFPLAASRKTALGVLGVAGATDVLDGWCARRLGQATATGEIVDGLADKLFGASVLATLVRRRVLPPAAALMLATRELLELPLVVRFLSSRAARGADVGRASNRLGKIATVVELVAVVAAVVRSRYARALVVVAALVGALAGVSYVGREVAVLRQLRAPLRSTTRA